MLWILCHRQSFCSFTIYRIDKRIHGSNNWTGNHATGYNWAHNYSGWNNSSNKWWVKFHFVSKGYSINHFSGPRLKLPPHYSTAFAGVEETTRLCEICLISWLAMNYKANGRFSTLFSSSTKWQSNIFIYWMVSFHTFQYYVHTVSPYSTWTGQTQGFS